MSVRGDKSELEINRTRLVWQLILRVAVGFYWIYFSSQRWFDPFGVKDLIITAAAGNYVPLYGEILRWLVAPNWLATTIGVTVLESAVGFMILLGVFTRVAGALGAFNSLNLTLTFSFCKCPWAEADFPLVFWFYFAPFLLNVQVIFDQSNNFFGLRRIIGKVF